MSKIGGLVDVIFSARMPEGKGLPDSTIPHIGKAIYTDVSS